MTRKFIFVGLLATYFCVAAPSCQTAPPTPPGPEATPAELAQYEADLMTWNEQAQQTETTGESIASTTVTIGSMPIFNLPTMGLVLLATSFAAAIVRILTRRQVAAAISTPIERSRNRALEAEVNAKAKADEHFIVFDSVRANVGHEDKGVARLVRTSTN